MYRKANSTLTASIDATNRVVVMCSDGFEDILDHEHKFSSRAAAERYLEALGFDGFDPNADLKAQGYVFIDGCYRKPN